MRKSLNYWELKELCNWLSDHIVGAPVQAVGLQGNELFIGFYPGKSILLAIDLNGSAPYCAILESGLPKAARDKKPLVLFLKSHLVGRRLTRVEINEELGRVFLLWFDDLSLELRLIPRAGNAIVSVDEKKISWKKVLPMVPAQLGDPPESIRSLAEITDQWRQKTQKKKPKDSGQKSKEKLTRAIGKVEKDIENKKEKLWQSTAEWIQSNWSLEVPEEFKPYIDQELNIAENLQRTFGKAKENKEKISSAEKRLLELKKQLNSAPEKPVERVSLLQVASVKGRTLEIDSVRAVFGKNAEDNLKLLRKAKAWDYWIHLRDHPSSHAIVSRNRNQAVTDATMGKIVQWLVRESISGNRFEGEMVAALIAECRYVTPIKGAKAGRVNYRNEKVIKVRV